MLAAGAEQLGVGLGEGQLDGRAGGSALRSQVVALADLGELRDRLGDGLDPWRRHAGKLRQQVAQDVDIALDLGDAHAHTRAWPAWRG